jgi:plasmid stabilization system protein ParE
MEHYEQVATSELANEFYRELREFMAEAAARPESFTIRARDIRRSKPAPVSLSFLFRIVGDTVRILVVRHHGRHPSAGMERR